MNAIWALFTTFAYLGLTSVGGAMTVIPEMERQVVVVHGWMSHQAFVEAYALGQFAPGPNMLHVFVIGYQVAGLPGALAAGLGMFGPTSLLLAGVAWWAGGPQQPSWAPRFHRAIGPATIGLMGAAAWTLGRTGAADWFHGGIMLAAAYLVGVRKLDPAWVVLGAAALGAAVGWAGR